MNECVQRWKENRPLSSGELAAMRVQWSVRLVCIGLLLGLAAIALCGCRSACAAPVAAPQVAPSAAKPQFPTYETPENEQTFDGVTLVVLVKRLTGFAPELRKQAALEADRVLRELARRHLPGKVRTRLIAQVAEPKVFEEFTALSGHAPQPVAVHVLVPARNTRLVTGVIVKKLQQLVASADQSRPCSAGCDQPQQVQQ